MTKASIVAGGRKEIANCHPSRAPEDMYKLEEMIDEISQSKRLVRNRSGQPVLKP